MSEDAFPKVATPGHVSRNKDEHLQGIRELEHDNIVNIWISEAIRYLQNPNRSPAKTFSVPFGKAQPVNAK